MKKSFTQFWRGIMNPAMFHGHGKAPPFFEGWYFKLVSADESRRYAIIPGVFMGEDAHAFVQVLNGNIAQHTTAPSSYHRFPLSDFLASEEKFEVRIGESYFSRNSIELKIDDSIGRIHGRLAFEGVTPWPVSILSPGIMGWYAWVPKMECYHGVLSLDHQIQGHMQIYTEFINFTGGSGYIEKDWGQSFPAGYVWFQCNHFNTPGT